MKDNTMNSSTFTGHIVSHTHWDREWRWPIWHTRYQLVVFFKELLGRLEADAAYRHFTLDGQSAMVEDYLEECPQDRERIKKLVCAGRLSIGPWYTLPDFWPVCGEALVRNLLAGVRFCAGLGGHLKVGYTTFGWGQIAQFPQILSGFGIDKIITAKNVSSKRAPRSEFWWVAPDGTKAFATRLAELGRANFYKRGLLTILEGREFWTQSWHYPWPSGDSITHRADADGWWLDYLRNARPRLHGELLKDAVEKAWQTTNDSLSPHRWLGDGCDYTGANPVIPQLIEAANKLWPERTFVHSSIAEYINAVYATVDKAQLIEVQGELRDPPVTAIQGGALSTRLYNKTLNRQAQYRLIHLAEPLVWMAVQYGMEYPAGFLQRAWKYLLLSHSHDAINGVVVDKIADDVRHRLQQVLELSDVLSQAAMEYLTARMQLGGTQADAILLVVFNSSPHSRREIIPVCIDTPAAWQVERLAICDEQGESLAVQPIHRKTQLAPVHDFRLRPQPFYCDRHFIYFDTGELPACGWKAYRIQPMTRQDRSLAFLYPRYDWRSRRCVGGMGMENDFIKLSFHADGSFDLLDKENGRTYPRLHMFEDSGDLGDYWHRTSPNRDEIVLSSGQTAHMAVICDGPLVTTFRAEIALMIPACGNWSEKRRSTERVELKLISEITLLEHERGVRIKTSFESRARDHRLMVLFPSYIRTEKAQADGHFIIEQRPIELARDTQQCGEGGMRAFPQQAWVNLEDEHGGLCLMNRGLTEYEISEDESRTIGMCLLRTAPMRICTEFRTPTYDPDQEGGQCIGHHVAEYFIYPHTGGMANGRVATVADQYNTPLRVLQTAPHAGNIPANSSLLEMAQSPIRLTAIKRADGDAGSWIIRLNNPGQESAMARLTFAQELIEVWRVNLMEDAIEQVPVEMPHELRILLTRGKIASYKLTFKTDEPGL